MLNYSAIIQAIIKQYKKHNKYVFSLLLLSVFVASVVCTALTKPAISMTNEMDNQLAVQFTPQNEFELMNLKGANSPETIYFVDSPHYTDSKGSEAHLNLSSYIGKTINKIEVQFGSNPNWGGYIVCGEVINNVMTNPSLGAHYDNSAREGDGQGLFVYTGLNIQIGSGYYLVISNENDLGYNVQSVMVTFSDNSSTYLSSGGGNNENISIKVTKVWSDGNENHGQVDIKLYKSTDQNNWNEQLTGQLASHNNWECTFSNLPKYENSAPCYYRVEEQNVPSGYNVSYSQNQIQAVNVSNNAAEVTVYNNADGGSGGGGSGSSTINLTLHLNWADGNNLFGDYQVQAQLYYADAGITDLSQLTDDMKVNTNSNGNNNPINLNRYDDLGWSNLPIESGKAYYVKETQIVNGNLSEYDVTYTNNGLNTSGTITITNTYKGSSPPPEEKITLNVEAEWSDGKDIHDKGEATVLLLESTDNSNWTDAGQSLTLNNANSWKGSFEVTKNDKYYRVIEQFDPIGYNQSSSPNSIKASDVNGSATIRITNTKEKASLKVKKYWAGVSGSELNNDVESVQISVYKKEGSSTLRLAPMRSAAMFSQTPQKLLKAGNDKFGTKYLSHGNLANNNDTEIAYFLGDDYAGNTVTNLHLEFNQPINNNVFIMFGEPKQGGGFEFNGSFVTGNNSNTLDWNGNGKQIQSNTYLLIADNTKRTDIACTKVKINFTMNLQMQFNWLDSSGNTTSSLSNNVQFQLYYADEGITDLNQLTDDKKATNIQNNLITLGSGQYTWNNLPIENGKAYYVKELTTGGWTTSYSNNGLSKIGTIVINNRVNSSGGGGSGGGSSDGDSVTFGERTFTYDSGYTVNGNSRLIVYDLNEYKGRKIKGIAVETDCTDYDLGFVLGPPNGSGIGYVMNGDIKSSTGNYFNSNSPVEIPENGLLALIPYHFAESNSKINSITIYLEPEGSGGTTTTTTTTTATTTTTTVPLVQPNGRNPDGYQLVETLTLNAANNWQETLDNLDIYADAYGMKVYEYKIIETSINLKSGATHEYHILRYGQDVVLLEENKTMELDVTNICNTSGFVMPSTGGTGTDVYYKTGFIMMIASGGIYITLAFIKKRKSLMSLKE